MTKANIHYRIAWLLDYEPTWFPEMASGLAVLIWSIGAALTVDYHVSGDAWIMPIAGMIFGPLRWALLFRVRYAPRVAAAFGGGVWWAWALCAAANHLGWVPGMGPVVAMLTLDVLTLARFSIPCVRDLYSDLRGWRGTQ